METTSADEHAEPLWRWPDLCTALGLEPEEGPAIGGISIDSRTVEPGDLFIALSGDPGPRFQVTQVSDRDGHDFVGAAVAAGAAGVLVSRRANHGARALTVANTLDALWALGAAARARMNGTVFAITGSSGKTTAKTWLAAALNAYSSPGSLNNHLGVPLSLARMPANTHQAVFEIGTNHPGEIAPLAKLVRPHVACLLNVHAAHIGNFPSMQSLIEEKLSIYKGLTGLSTLVLEDNHHLNKDGVRTISHGTNKGTDVRLLNLDTDSSTANISIDGHVLPCHVPGGGKHRARTLAAVVACLKAADLPLEPAQNLGDSLVPRGRGAVTVVGHTRIIDDSYNANPESMRQALLALADHSGHKLAILGDMLELGDLTESAHANLVDVCGQIDGVICVGDRMPGLYERLRPNQRLGIYPDATALLAQLKVTLPPADVILIKGSNGVFWQHDFVTHLIQRLTSTQI